MEQRPLEEDPVEGIPQDIRVLTRHYVEQAETKGDVTRRFGVSRQCVYNVNLQNGVGKDVVV